MRKLFILFALAFAGVTAQANLVTNGSFEDNVINNRSWTVLTGDQLTGWTAASNGVELRNNVSGVAQDGFNFVELDVRRNSAISQSISIDTVGDYLLSFWYQARPDMGNRNSNSARIGWTFGQTDMMQTDGGSVLNNFRVVQTGGVDGWFNFSELLNITTTGDYNLRFFAAGVSDGYGGSLDNVSVSAVPEPASLALMLAGLGLMVGVARRRTSEE